MKKIVFMLGFLAIFLAFNQTYAEENNVNTQKRVQHYKDKFILGGNLIMMNSSSEIDSDSSTKIVNNISIDESGFGAGLNARYKIYFQKENKNSIFLTPEIFYNFASTSGNDERGYGMFDVELEQSYGAKLSLGFEFENKHSISIGGILQNITHTYKYKLNNISYNEEGDDFAYGVAVDYEYQMMKHLSFNFGVSGTFLTFDLPNNNLTLGGVPANLEMTNTIVNFYVGLNYIF